MDTRNNPIIIDATNTPRAFQRTQTASSLLSQVLVIASLGFFVSAVGVYLAPPVAGGGIFMLCFIVSLVLIFAIRATRKNAIVSFSLFMVFALVMGIEIAPWINHLLHTGQTTVVFDAAMTTAVGMACLGIGAQIFTFDYRRVRNYAYAALFALIIVGILSMFFHFISPNAYSYLTLAIFSVLVVVDFMRIRNNGDGATAIELALSIYLDGINIFLALTRIFSGSRD
jgi:FtsH-binding integral membrane protein